MRRRAGRPPPRVGSEPDTVELIDDVGEAVRSPWRISTALVVAVVGLVAVGTLVVVASLGGDDDAGLGADAVVDGGEVEGRVVGETGAGDQSSATEEPAGAAITPAAGDGEPANGDQLPWPALPPDHHPQVATRPGPGVALLGRELGISVVYVNSRGAPTVLDLDTGTFQEIDIAPDRSYDAFLVEFGRVVSDGRNMNVEPAGSRAAVFHVHRPFEGVIAPDSEELQRMPGPALCLAATPCAGIRWNAETLVSDRDRIQRFDVQIHRVVAPIFTDTLWKREGRWITAPEGVAPDFRIPAPLDDQIWIVTQ